MMVKKLTAAINQSGSQIDIRMHENVLMKKGLGFNLAKGAYLENQSIEATWRLVYDINKKQLSFDKTNVAINNHSFLIAGHFIFSKTEPSFAIDLDSKNVTYSSVKEIVTATIRGKLEKYDLQGGLDVKAAIGGSLLPAMEPSVNISCISKNNKLHTSFADFDACSFTGNFTNSMHPDSGYSDKNSQISFVGFNADWGGIPVTAKNILVTNLETPALRADVHVDAAMEALDNKLGLKEMAFENGRAILDLSYDGLLHKDGSPQIEKIEGSIALKKASINYIPRNFEFENCNGVIQLFRDSISMQGFTCNYGSNQFTVNVDGSNLRGKFIAVDTVRPSVITCSIASPAVNLGDFTALFGDKKIRRKARNGDQQLGELSQKIDAFIGNSIIDITMKAGNIKNQRLEGKNFDAHIRFEPAQWVLSKIALQAAGGMIQAKGKVDINSKGYHRAKININVNNADVNRLLVEFDNFGQDAVTDKELHGTFTTNSDLQLDINGAGHIVPGSLLGNLNFSLKNGSLQKFAPFDRLKTFVFKKRNLEDVRFAEIKDKFDISGDGIYINRMEVQSSAFRLYIEGNYGLSKKNTDLLMQLPFSNLNDNSFSPDSTLKNRGTGQRKAGNIWLRAINDENGKIKVKLTLNRKVGVNKDAEEKK